MVLKTSWGIVIFLDVEEIINPIIFSSDRKITDRIYLRINTAIRWTREFVGPRLEQAINALTEDIYKKIGDENVVCFYVRDVDFNMTHFQEEGLYCAMREWLMKYYSFELESVPVTYSKFLNRYIFELPKPGENI